MFLSTENTQQKQCSEKDSHGAGGILGLMSGLGGPWTPHQGHYRTCRALSGGKAIFSKRMMTHLFSIKQANCVIVTHYHFFPTGQGIAGS